MATLSKTVMVVSDANVPPRAPSKTTGSPGDKYAEAGFSHTGDGKRAICSDCHAKPRPAPGEDLKELHAEISPECDFVKKVIFEEKTYKEESALPNVQREVRDGTKNKSGEATSAQDPRRGAQDRLSELRDQVFCETCRSRHSCIMFTPCSHKYSCEECAENESICKRCKSPIKGKEKVYRV